MFRISCFIQTTIAMVVEDKVGSAFRASNIRLQGTVAGSIFGFLATVAFKVGCHDFLRCSALCVYAITERWRLCSAGTQQWACC